MRLISFIFLFFLAFPDILQAACVNPPGAAGTLEYFTAPDNAFKYCDGAEWTDMGGSPAGILTGWPDAIRCLRTDGGSNIFFLLNTNIAGKILYTEGATGTILAFNAASKNFMNCYTNSGGDGSGACNHISAADCRNTAQGINRLIGEGRAYTFTKAR